MPDGKTCRADHAGAERTRHAALDRSQHRAVGDAGRCAGRCRARGGGSGNRSRCGRDGSRHGSAGSSGRADRAASAATASRRMTPVHRSPTIRRRHDDNAPIVLDAFNPAAPLSMHRLPIRAPWQSTPPHRTRCRIPASLMPRSRITPMTRSGTPTMSLPLSHRHRESRPHRRSTRPSTRAVEDLASQPVSAFDASAWNPVAESSTDVTGSEPAHAAFAQPGTEAVHDLAASNPASIDTDDKYTAHPAPAIDRTVSASVPPGIAMHTPNPPGTACRSRPSPLRRSSKRRRAQVPKPGIVCGGGTGRIECRTGSCQVGYGGTCSAAGRNR